MLLVAYPTLVLCLAAGALAEQAVQLPDRSNSGWQLHWQDEFDVSGPPDPDHWAHEVNCWGGGNSERQCYTDRPENSYVGDDGLLHIVAREEHHSGPSLQDDTPGYPGPNVSRRFTSARLRTLRKVDLMYGRVEVRAQLPGGRGMWPAIWMLPTEQKYGGWPSSGEIDIVEAVNLARGDFNGSGDIVHGTLHYGLRWPQWENHGQAHAMDSNPADGFHEFAIEWDEDEIRWYVDGVHYQTQRAQGWYNYVWGGQDKGFGVANGKAPFDQLFHLMLNVAVGGNWPGEPDTGWDAHREMRVDHVRIYKCIDDAGAETSARKCRTVNASVEYNDDVGSPGTHQYMVYDDGISALGSTEMQAGSTASQGVKTDSRPTVGDAWAIEFTRDGALDEDTFRASVYLGAADTSGMDGANSGFQLNGGAGWSVNGELEFDLLVESIAPETKLFVKMDSGDRNSGAVQLDVPTAGEWRHVAVKVADLLSVQNAGQAPLIENSVRRLFILEGTGPARIFINRVRLECAFNRDPEDWQIDKTCSLSTRKLDP